MFLFCKKFTGGNSGPKIRFGERKIGHGSQRIANIAEYFLGTANICCNLQIADVRRPFQSLSYQWIWHNRIALSALQNPLFRPHNISLNSYVPLSDSIPKIYVFKCTIIIVDGFSQKSSMARQTVLNHDAIWQRMGICCVWTLVTRWVKNGTMATDERQDKPSKDTVSLITAASFLLELGSNCIVLAHKICKFHFNTW